MVAWDQKTLESLFESGLGDAGDQNLRIDGKPVPYGPMVPAAFAAPTPAAGAPQGLDRATIRTNEVAHPQVFVAIRDGGKLRIAS